MRIEDVGSLSPAGDLLAFSIALVLTFGVVSTYSHLEKIEDDNFNFALILASLETWDLLDGDGDGVLSYPDEDSIKNSSCFIYQDIKLKVDLLSFPSNYSFNIIDGYPYQSTGSELYSTPVFSDIVLFEFHGTIEVGNIRVGSLEDVI